MTTRLLVAVAITIASLVSGVCARAQGRSALDLAMVTVPGSGERVAYGSDPLQFGELRLPSTKGPYPVAIVIHGGCWVSQVGTLDPRAVLYREHAAAGGGAQRRRHRDLEHRVSPAGTSGRRLAGDVSGHCPRRRHRPHAGEGSPARSDAPHHDRPLGGRAFATWVAARPRLAKPARFMWPTRSS